MEPAAGNAERNIAENNNQIQNKTRRDYIPLSPGALDRTSTVQDGQSDSPRASTTDDSSTLAPGLHYDATSQLHTLGETINSLNWDDMDLFHDEAPTGPFASPGPQEVMSWQHEGCLFDDSFNMGHHFNHIKTPTKDPLDPGRAVPSQPSAATRTSSCLNELLQDSDMSLPAATTCSGNNTRLVTLRMAQGQRRLTCQ